MPDRRFFKSPKPLSLREIASKTDAQLAPGSDPDFIISDVAPLDSAGSKDLSFFENKKYKKQYETTQAGACITSPNYADNAPEGIHLLLSSAPYKSYALAARCFYPEEKPPPGISEQAFISPKAMLAENIRVDAGAVIEEGAEIGTDTHIGPGAVVHKNVVIGRSCRIGANVSISHALIGDFVFIYRGACIGQDGFGFAPDPKGHVKVPQLGRVIIKDHVHIGANTAIDRGAGPDTVIGEGTWIDNLVQIAHNVKIGKGCIIVAQVGISGSTVIDDFAVLAGQVGIIGHLHIGEGAKIAAQSGVMRDIPAGKEYFGSPALPIKEKMRQIAALNRLIKNKKSS